MSGLRAGRVQLWAASGRVIQGTGGKARSGACERGEEDAALGCLPGTGGQSLPCQPATDGAPTGGQAATRNDTWPCSLRADCCRRKMTVIRVAMPATS